MDLLDKNRALKESFLWHLLKNIQNRLFLGSAPEGVDDLCFHTCRNFLFFFSFSCIPPQSRPEFQHGGSYPSLEAKIPSSRPKSQSRGPIPGGGGENSPYESIGHRPLQGRCPAPPLTSTTTYLSRAQVLHSSFLKRTK